MKTKLEIILCLTEQDGAFLPEVPERPRLITDGAPRAEALREEVGLVDDYLAKAWKEGWSLPEARGRLAFA